MKTCCIRHTELPQSDAGSRKRRPSRAACAGGCRRRPLKAPAAGGRRWQPPQAAAFILRSTAWSSPSPGGQAKARAPAARRRPQLTAVAGCRSNSGRLKSHAWSSPSPWRGMNADCSRRREPPQAAAGVISEVDGRRRRPPPAGCRRWWPSHAAVLIQVD